MEEFIAGLFGADEVEEWRPVGQLDEFYKPWSEKFKEFSNSEIEPGLMKNLMFSTWFFIGALTHFPMSGVDKSGVQKVCIKHSTETLTGIVLKYAYVKIKPSSTELALRHIVLRDMEEAISTKKQSGLPPPRYTSFTTQEIRELVSTFRLDQVNRERLTTTHRSLQWHDQDLQWRYRESEQEQYGKVVIKELESLESGERIAARGMFYNPEQHERQRQRQQQQVEDIISSFLTIDGPSNNAKTRAFSACLAGTNENNPAFMKKTTEHLLGNIGDTFRENLMHFRNIEHTSFAHLAFTAGSLIMNFKSRFHLHVSIEKFLYDRRIQLRLLNTGPRKDLLSARVPVIIEGAADNDLLSTRSSVIRKSEIQAMLPSFSDTDSKRAMFATIRFNDHHSRNYLHVQPVKINQGLFYKFILTKGFRDSLSTTEQIRQFIANEARFLEGNLKDAKDLSEVQSFLLGQFSAVPAEPDVEGEVLQKYTFEHEVERLNQDFATMLVKHGSDMYAIILQKAALEVDSVSDYFFKEKHISFRAQSDKNFLPSTVTTLKCSQNEHGIAAVIEKGDMTNYHQFPGSSIPLAYIDVSTIIRNIKSSAPDAFSQVSDVLFNNRHIFADQHYLKSFFKGLFFAHNIIIPLFHTNRNGLLGIVEPENSLNDPPMSSFRERAIGAKFADSMHKWGGIIVMNMEVVHTAESVSAMLKSTWSELLMNTAIFHLDSSDPHIHLCAIVGNAMTQDSNDMLKQRIFNPLEERVPETLLKSDVPSCSGRHKRSFSEMSCRYREMENGEVIEKSADENRFIVNNKKLLKFLKRESPQKSAALLEEITLFPESMITLNGPLVDRSDPQLFIRKVRFKSVLKKAAISSHVANQLMVYKDIVGDIMRGDWKGFAALVSLIYISKTLEAAAGKMRQTGMMLKTLPNFKYKSFFLRSTAPLLGRLTSAFIIYDLYQNVNQMKKHGFDIDSAVNVASDAIFLLIDVTSMAIDLLAAFASLGRFASFAGAVGMTLGVIVLIGANAFRTYRRISQIDHLIHLSSSEKFVEGLRAFFGMTLHAYLADLIERKQVYNHMVDEAEKFLNKQEQFKNYVFPLLRKTENGTWVDIDDNVIYMREKNTSIHFGRDHPDSNKESKLVCFNSILHSDMSDALDKFLSGSFEPAPVKTNSSDGFFICSNSIGISLDKSTTDSSLIVLKDGNDLLLAPVYTSNYVVVGNGKKYITGGLKNDVFFFTGTYVFGKIDGVSGDDTADFTNFAPEATRLEIDAINELIYAPGTNIFTHSISQWVGRVNLPDTVTCSCKTTMVNSKGGSSAGLTELDFIDVPNLNCYFNITIVVDDNTIVYNEAIYGHFVYIIGRNNNYASKIRIYNNGLTSQHKLLFPFHIEEVSRIEHKKNYAIFTMNNNTTVSVSYQFDNKNVYFLLGDGLLIRFEQNNTLNIYGHAPINVHQMRQSFIEISERLNTTFTVFSTVSNVTLLVSHSNKHLDMGYPFYTSNIIHNDPYDETVICGGHGENVYIIVHKKEKLKSTDQARLPNIDIWEDLDMNHTRILSLRNLQEKVEEDLGLRTYIDLEVTKEDVIVSVLLKNNLLKNSILICTITFKELASQEQLIESLIIINRQPINILKRADSYVLKPPEVIVPQNASHVVLYADMIECGTTYKIQKNAPTYESFVENKTLIVLVCCDIYTKIESMVIVFVDFYTNVEIFESLEIQFTNRRLILEDMKSLETQKQLSTHIEKADNQLNEMLSQFKAQEAAR